MRPTLFGARALLFYAVVTGAYFAAPYVNLFFLLLSFLTLHWLLGITWTWRSLRGVSASFGGVEPVASGSTANVSCQVEVSKGRRFDVAVALQLEGAAKSGSRRERRRARAARRVHGHTHVLEGSTTMRLSSEPLPRGIHRVESTRLTSTYPFNLLERRVPVDGPRELVVYPAPAATATESRSAEDLVREMMGGGHTDGDLQPSGLRDFLDGDSLRTIHWRASARRGKFVVQEWEGGGGDGLELVLDRRCDPAELEEALSEVSALVHLAREGKEVLSIRSQGTVETYGEGHSPWSAALRFLAAADVLPESGPAPPPTSPRVLRLPRSHAHAK